MSDTLEQCLSCGYENPRIIVTGPHRAGTRIASKIIAHELEYDYVSEEDIDIDDIQLFYKSLEFENVVVQAPGVSSFCHVIPNVLVVYMLRDIDEIIESQQRINWQFEQYELSKYFIDEGIISMVKYESWEYQKRFCKNFFELEYNDLKDHEFFIDRESRRHFLPTQTDFEEPLN